MPEISIVTVNLDNAKSLVETIKSVEFQTYTDFEYIIIDGGSKDESLNIIKEYLGVKEKPTMEEIINLIPEEKRIIILTKD